MARQPRYFVKGQAQRIIQRGNNREPIFADDQDYRFYLECLQESCEEHRLSIHSCGLMTNHVHFQATPESDISISKTLQSLGRRYVQYFNYTYARTGTLWEGRYKMALIDSENYLLICMRYIELNPVRATMVAHPGDYLWSSYRANAHGADNPLVSHNDLYRRLGRNDAEWQSAYRQLFRAAVNLKDLEAIRESTNKGWVSGNNRFRERIERLSGRRAAPMARGRPSNDT